MGESCVEFCAGAALFLFNGVDLLAGVGLTIYSLYLGTNHYAPLWLYLPLLAVGGVLLAASLMSGCGLAFRRFSACMALSSDLLIWISLAELGLAVVIITQGSAIDKFLRAHQQQLELSGEELAQFERHKYYPAYVLLLLFFMEALRQRFSNKLHRAHLERQYRYEMLA